MTKGKTGLNALIISVICILYCSGNALAISPEELAGKIAFLKGGEVWIADKDSRKARQLTKANGKVENFLFSPTLNYLAYSKIIGQITEPGLPEEDEEGSQRPLYSIVIMDLNKEGILTEIMPSRGEWIYPEEWLSGDRLLYYNASGSEVSGFFEFDAQKETEREVEWKPGLLLKADVSQDGLLMVYVSDTGQGAEYREHLHLVDLRSKEDKILVSQTGIKSPRISHDKKQIAFMEAGTKDGKQTGNFWIYTIEEGTLKKIYTKEEGGSAAVSWSLDDTYIGLWSPLDAVVIELRNPRDVYRMKGTDFHWTTNNNIIFALEGNIYLLSPDKREKELFVKDASKPVFLKKTGQERKLKAQPPVREPVPG